MTTTSQEKTRSRQTLELAKRLGRLTQAQAATGWAVVIILSALLGAIYLNQTSKIAAIGRQVQREQAKLDEIKSENANIERLIAEAQALDRLNAEALRLGFVPANSEEIDYRVIPDYPVEAAPEPREALITIAPLSPPETIWEALSLALRDLGIGLTRGDANE